MRRDKNIAVLNASHDKGRVRARAASRVITTVTLMAASRKYGTPSSCRGGLAAGILPIHYGGMAYLWKGDTAKALAHLNYLPFFSGSNRFWPRSGVSSLMVNTTRR